MMKRAVILVAVLLLLQLSAFRTVGADYPGNQCLSFDGTSNYVDFGNSSIFRCFKLTIEAWIEPKYNIQHGSDGTYGHAFGTVAQRRFMSSIISQGGWWFGFNYANGVLEFAFTTSSGGGSTYYDATSTFWNSSLWYHIAITYDPEAASNNLNFYVNGTLDSSFRELHSIYYENYPLQVGEESNSQYYLGNFAYAGLIDEFRIWNVSRTQAEIQSAWNRTLTNTEVTNPNLVGYWHFDDGSGNYTQDSSLYGNVGTLTNSPQWITPGAPIVPEFSSILVMLVLMTTISISAILLQRRLRKLNRARFNDRPSLQ